MGDYAVGEVLELAKLHPHLRGLGAVTMGVVEDPAPYRGCEVGTVGVSYFHKDVPMTGYEQATRRVEWRVTKIQTVPSDACQPIRVVKAGVTVAQELVTCGKDYRFIVILTHFRDIRMDDNYLFREWDEAVVLLVPAPPRRDPVF